MRERPAFSTARTWRDIPQDVKPRAMSPEGRRRLRRRLLRAAAGVAVLGGLAAGAWEVAAAMGGSGQAAADRGAPIRSIALRTDGVLDRTWLAAQLDLPKGATLMGVDLARLRDRVLASGQARTAAIVRNFPSTLSVAISERRPVARVMAQTGTQPPKALLVARDGVVYDGAGYDPAALDALPWLDGIRLARQGLGFAPIEGMDQVADLLARAQAETAPIYRSWRVVSLARLQSDGQILTRTAAGLTVVFGTREDFVRQLAKLDLLLEAAGSRQGTVREIDLSLGGQVPVEVADPASPPVRPPSGASSPASAAPPPTPRFHIQI